MTGQNSGDGMRNAIAGYLQIPKVQASSCQQKQAECAMSTTSLQSAVLSATFYVNTCVVRGYQPRSTIHIHYISSPHLRISATKRAACRMRKPLRVKYCLFRITRNSQNISRKQS